MRWISDSGSDEYAPIARLYDTLLGPLLLPLRREVCRVAEHERLRHILDICCGTGQQAVLLHSAGLKVTGLDLSPAMLRVARKKSPRDLPYVRGDAVRLPFREGQFEGVLFSFALHEKGAFLREAIVKEALRVLSPGGRFMVADYLVPAEGDLAALWRSKAARFVEWCAGESHYRAYREFMNSGGLDGLLARHGLEVLWLKRYHGGATALAVSAKRK